MHILVLGGGVVGVSTAYYLAKAGHSVTVIDRQPGPGLETSFANAGEVSPGYSAPWAGPGVPVKAIKWLLMEHGPLVVRPRFDPAMWLWMIRMLRNCTAARYAVNKSRMMRLAEYSRDELRRLRAETGIRYDERSQGTLQLFRTQAHLDHTGDDIAVLQKLGVPFEKLDPEGCIRAEPALARVRPLFVGGLRLPDDETGDCQMFTSRLAELAASAGVTFRFDTTIDRMLGAGDRIEGVVLRGANGEPEQLRADHYVTCLGSFSPLLLNPLGLSLPIYPVKGYSITVPIDNPDAAPVSTVMDETYKVAITRLGNRIRVGGTAEISGYGLALHPARRATLEKSLGDVFPEGGDRAKASFWTGLRPMTPDGTPIIGPTRYANLHLNTGHGTLGWTMACGSARVVADLLSGRRPEIETADLALTRY